MKAVAPKPRALVVPPSSSNAIAEVVDLSASAGLMLDDWQAVALESMLGEREDGTWSAFECGLIVARQNGKGAVLEARTLAGLFLFNEPLILWSAHQFKTASESFRRMLSLIENTDHLRRLVKSVRTSHGEEGIEMLNGSRLKFVARSRNSARGFTGDLVILDEAQELDTQDLAALIPTLAAVPNPQVIYTGTVSTSATTLRSVRDRALAGSSPRLSFVEWSADPSADSDDRAGWEQANPALTSRLSTEFIEAERQALDESFFRMERLSIWPDPDTDQRVIALDVWEASRIEMPSMGDPVTFGIDAVPDRSWCSIAVAGKTPTGYHTEITDHREGMAWVISRAAEIAERWHPSGFVIDPRGAAGSLIPGMKARGLNVIEMSSQDVGAACGLYFDLVHGGELSHLGQASLNTALAGAKKRAIGDAWGWDRKHAVDISPLCASTFAVFGSQAPDNKAGLMNLNDYL